MKARYPDYLEVLGLPFEVQTLVICELVSIAGHEAVQKAITKAREEISTTKRKKE